MKIHKLLTICAISGLLMVSVPVFAQTAPAATSSSEALIQMLQNQITALKTQIEALRAAQTNVKEAAGNIQDTLKLIGQLREGSSGENVKLLQVILAADQDIYPEGLITGFFGKLTALAVKKFQKKNGLEQIGLVGPKTLEKLNKELEKNPVIKEERTEKDKKGKEKTTTTHCAIIPPGHLIAPGWLRKQGGVSPIIPECQTLPLGIATKLGMATSTPDLIAPIISQLTTTGITQVSTHITWSTNEKATSKIWYGTSTPIILGTPNMINDSLMINHDILLSDLMASTTYYYTVGSSDASKNTATSSQQSFTTMAQPDVIAPIISQVSALNITSSSTQLTWATNELADGKLWYATSTPLQINVHMAMASSTALSLNHSLEISGLEASTTYYYTITSTDAFGNVATSSTYSFVTLPIPDTTPPLLTGVSVTGTSTSSTHIVWSTNEPATSKVWYATSTPVTMNNALTASSDNLATSHDLLLENLTSSSTYYFMTGSTDAAGNTTTSSEMTFQTQSVSSGY